MGRGEAVSSPDDCKNPTFTPPKGKFCPFNYKDTFNDPKEACTLANKFGYDKGQPCILIKLNKVRSSLSSPPAPDPRLQIYGWTPKPYAPGTFPSKMPSHDAAGHGVVITCEGEVREARSRWQTESVTKSLSCSIRTTRSR